MAILVATHLSSFYDLRLLLMEALNYGILQLYIYDWSNAISFR
jgi:hypothetical protein